MEELKSELSKACRELFDVGLVLDLTRPAEKFGDFSTNVAMQLAGKLGKQPREIAEQLAPSFQQISFVSEVSIAGPGFINLRLTDEKLIELVSAATEFPKPLAGQEIVLEHTDPNPFKEFHIGHAYSNTVGVAIGKLLEVSGATVHQVTYQGDVGLHIAMAVYGLKNGQELFKAYAYGVKSAEEDEQATQEIEAINSELYNKSDQELIQVYAEGRQQSLEEFERIYHTLGAVFEKNYFESDTSGEGMEVVRRNIGKVFEESDGAIIFRGEKVGLHTRVFISSKGLPTYEAKEIGLAFAKERDYPQAAKFIVVTANEIDDYFAVLVAAIKEIDNSLADKIQHVSHGVVKFPSGKMSSRTGNIKTFVGLHSELEAKTKELYPQDKASGAIVLGAMKYEFLKHRLGSDFIFDVGESISLQGNSGPYLQYAYARACGILEKATAEAVSKLDEIEAGERSLILKISEFPEAVAKAASELMPHHICSYLYELAQEFNRFYEKNRVIGAERQTQRLVLVRKYSEVLKNGLYILNIEAPDKI